MKDDLQKFHERNMADEQYAIARQLLDLGDAVARLREEQQMTRGELGRQLRVKARDIAHGRGRDAARAGGVAGVGLEPPHERGHSKYAA